VTNHYLLKTEPSDYSFADLVRDRETVWDGVLNPVALKHLRAMQPGDRVLIYETGRIKGVVGTARVTSAHAPDSKEPAVRIEAAKPLAKPIPLAQIKSNKLFAQSALVRQGRLSVVPLSEAQYRSLSGE